MQREGPNKSEELLKRYARERSEQAPKFSLHPATRRLLQGEVIREFPKRARSFAWFNLVRGRLVFGTALAGVVVTGFCLWWNNQSSRQVEVAKAERRYVKY